MLPFFFGSKQRRLFGMYEPAAKHRKVPRAVLLCNSWGNEYLYAHRAMRRLAKRLTAAGFDTLRFDYFGSGDSGGETTDADLDGWRQDVWSAARELKEMSGAQRVSVVGLRLGATLAAEGSRAMLDSLDRLVLWDPIIRGSDYLRELEARSVDQAGCCTADPAAGVMLHGYDMSSAFVAGLKAIDLCSEELGLPAKVLTIFTGNPPANCPPLASGEVANIAAAAPWKDPSERGEVLPIDVYDRILTWLQ